jgi:hypothetical protein
VKVHELKSHPQYFGPLAKGERHVELRNDDRGYQVRDLLVLREWDPDTESFTGRHRVARVTHIIRGGVEGFSDVLKDGWVALSLRIFREPRSI